MSERADRLGAAMLLFGVVREPARDALDGAKAAGLLTREQWAAWRASDDEDLRLAHACREAEFEHRDRQWCALDLLGAALNPTPMSLPATGATEGAAGAGETPTPMVVVPAHALADVARAALGWDTLAPEGA